MDFINKLPPSKDITTDTDYNGILVMVDRLTKYSHFVPYSEEFNAEKLARLVLDRLIQYHGIPKVFITDRDKLFTSNYWKTLVNTIGIRHKLSTSFHPQTDGQTERSNQTLETYLRHYVSYAQDNWVTLLPMAQVAINNSRSETTGETPFFANFGKHPNLFHEPGDNNPLAEKALVQAQDMKDLHDTLRLKINQTQDKLLKTAKNQSKTAPQLKRGDKVYLLTKNFNSKRPSRKLDPVKV